MEQKKGDQIPVALPEVADLNLRYNYGVVSQLTSLLLL